MSADQTSNPDQDLADGLATLTDEERAALNEDVDDLRRDDTALDDDDADDGADDDGKQVADKPAAEADDDVPDEPAEPKAAAPASEAKPPAEAEAVADEGPDPDARQERAPVFVAQLPADFEDRKTALQTREEEAEQKYEDGEIDRATYRATLRELAAERETLVRIQTKVELSQEMAQQEEQRELSKAVGVVMTLGTEAGIDYNKDANWAELKAFVTVVEARNPTKSVEWIMREAHRRVLVANDITPPKPEPKADPKPAAKADPKAEALARRKPDASKAQPTLAQVPGGDGPGDVGSEFADIDALEGDKYEQALERLRKSNPAAYEKYMAEA